MNENVCNLSLGNDKRIIISDISYFGTRNITRINLFFSTLKNITFTTKDNTYFCEINTPDLNQYSLIIKKIVDYLLSLKSDITISESITNILNTYKEYELKKTETKNKLIQVKNSDIKNDVSFLNFCAESDKKLRINLRDYQYNSAFLFVTGNGGFEFSVPGSGKTIITYAAYSFLKDKQLIDKILIVGPNNAYNAWWDEYNTCFGEYPDFENLANQTSNMCKIYLNSSINNHKEITFINYDKIRLLADEICKYLETEKFLLIFDEAHYIKNPQAITTQKALQITRFANSRILLTGTPMPNGYEDLFSLTKILSPFNEILPYNYEQLKSMSRNDATETQIKKIKDSIFPFYSRISKKYLISKNELKTPIYHVVPCTMDANQVHLYERLNSFCGKTQDFNLDEEFIQSFKKALLIRKMQISANPSLLKKSLIQSMDEIKCNDTYSERQEKELNTLIQADKTIMKEFQVSEILKLINYYDNKKGLTEKNNKAIQLTKQLVDDGKKVLLWDIFVDNMFYLHEELDNEFPGKVEIICGSINLNDRQEAIKRFREGSSMVLIANPATLAESISLHRCCQNAIYINRNFNAAQFIQSKDRIHRINMPEGTTATYYFLENEDSVDIAVDEKLNKKETRMLQILDSDELQIGGAEFEDYSVMNDNDIEDCYTR